MGLPKPFQRPSINLGGGPKKDWQEVEAQRVSAGDIVRGWGLVTDIRPAEDSTTDRFLDIYFKSDEHPVTFVKTETVTAFTAV